jgi:hypothetical protein
MFVIKNPNAGLYYVENRGFSGNRAQATRITASAVGSTQDCLARAIGVRGVAESATTSFAPNYVRKENIGSTFYAGARRNIVNADRNNPSNKRFATAGEAANHAFRNLEGEGRATHAGFFVTETNDPVTHYVSVKEDPRGLTCPITNA